MLDRTVLCAGGLVIAGAVGMTGCGEDTSGKKKSSDLVRPASLPPPAVPTAKTAHPSPVKDPGERAGIAGARAALQRFLRGQATGDPSVCRYVAAGSPFVKGPALRGDCRKGVRNTPHFLRPQERQALLTVTVTGGRLKGENEAVLPFTGLRWTGGNLHADTLQDAFTLRRTGGIWQIVR